MSDMSYGQYLGLDRLLSAQAPRSGNHDEMLFIVIHQASELWMKLCLHELRAARDLVAADELSPAFKMLARVARIQVQLIQSWEVLSTMTPHDYSTIRPFLGSSSGFQSWQYRLIEFIMGAKDARHLAIHRADPEAHAALTAAIDEPGLYDETLRLLARRGFAIPQTLLTRDLREPHTASPEVEAAWATIYADPRAHWDLYELAEKLVDLDYRLQQWRFAHLKTVERIIGFKRGTGGTAGVPYLESVLKRPFFPELLTVRTAL